jgi:hypothetical protein
MNVRVLASVRRFQIEGGLLLLDECSNCLYAHNDIARHVWDLIEAGGAEEDWVSNFPKRGEFPERAPTSTFKRSWRSGAFTVCWRGARTEWPRLKRDRS